MPETRRYIEMLQRPDGRFLKADAKTEALVLDALRTLGCEDEKIYERAKEYLLTLENPDWGFSSKPGNESSVEGTYYAVSVLKKLGVKKDEATDYVLSLQRNDGSFFRDEAHLKVAILERGPIHDALNSTSFAGLALKTTCCREKPIFEKAEKFIRRQQHLDGSFGMDDGSINETYYAILALDKLGELDDSAGQRAEKFILGMQSKNGGFFSIIDDRFLPGKWQVRKCENVENTFYAISALDIIGRRDDGVCRKAGDYVTSLRKPDGSFCHSRSEPGPLGEPPGTSTLLSTAYAVLTLGLLDEREPA